MTDAGFRARIYAVEWHATLWLQNGVPRGRCEAMIRHCSECVEADFYGEPRPVSDDPEISRMQAFFDRLFSSELRGPMSFD